MQPKIDSSVVIGFKDWGFERLLLSIATIKTSFGRYAGEVIVSDYGSLNGLEVKNTVEAAGALYVRTETDGTWSRSRAINAGLAHAQGEVLISTDADMLFSPGAIETVIERILDSPDDSIVLQCRDLPSKYSHEAIDLDFLDWDSYELTAKLRPRWGMGGMFAASRKTVMGIRGYDSRMHTYGGEDLDFATRVRRSGSPLTWIDEPHVRMFHVWHPSTRAAVDKTAAGTDAISHNREIYYQDKTFIRNVESGSFSLQRALPACSIVMVVTEFSAYLADSIWSALNQSFEDFELVVIDAAEDNRVTMLLSEVDDARLTVKQSVRTTKYAALNHAVRIARGPYTVIHDEWSFMSPARLVEQFRALTQGFVGTYGGMVRVNSRSGELEPVDNAWFNRSAIDELIQATTELSLMMRTDLLRKIPFDEDCDETAGARFVDRVSNSGVALNHTGWYHCLTLDFDSERSEEFLEDRDARRRLVAARRELLDAGQRANIDVPPPVLRPKEDLEAFALEILPSHFARRCGWVNLPRSINAASQLEQLDSPGHSVRVEHPDGAVVQNYVWLESVSTRDLALLRAAKADLSLTAVRNGHDQADTFSGRNLMQEALVQQISVLTDTFFAPGTEAKWLVFLSPTVPDPKAELYTEIAGALPAAHRVIQAGQEKAYLVAIGSEDLADLWPLLARHPHSLKDTLAGIFSTALRDQQIDDIYSRSEKGRVKA